FTTPDGQSKTLNIPDGVYGTDGSITIPDFDGYTHKDTTLPVIYGPDGVAIVNTKDLYTPVKSKSGQTATFTTPDGQSKTLNIPDGVYGTDGSITIPDFDGYTHKDTTLPVIYGPDGVAIVNTTDIYSPVKSKSGQTATFTTPDGQSKILDIPAGEYGTNGSITIPDFNGYTHTNTTVPVIYGPDGVAIVNTKDLYTPVKSNPGQTATFTTPDGQSKTLDIPAGEYGTNGSITIPDFDGYTHTNTTVPVIYGPDGVAIVNTTDIYSPVKSKSGQTVTFTAPNGQSRTIDIPEGAYGTDGSITVPNIDGYTHDEEVPVSYDKDGNAIVNTDKIYTPIHFDATTTTVKTPEGNKTITIPEGNYGDDPKTVDVPSVTGYISAPLTVTYNADGTTSINTPSSLYTPVHSNGGTAKFTTPDGQTQTVNIPAGDFGTNGNISIPDFEGYTHEDKTIPVIYDANGNAIVKTDGLYTPIHFDPTTTTVKTPEGNKTVTIPEGNYGDNPKTVDVPSITGYTSNPLTVTYNADGTTSIDTPNKLYMPVHSDGDKATFITPNGDTTVDIPAGDFSKKDVTIDVPQVTGYNTNVDKVPVTYNADGSASADTKVIYTPVHSDGGTATIKTPDGPVTIDIPEGDYSKSNVTTVNVPKVHGYTTSTDTLKVTYDANGNATINTSDVSYTGVENKSTSINLKNPDGKVTSLDIPAGRFGDDPVTITAQNISGYTAPSIIVTFGADGIPTIVDAKTPDKEISTSDTLTYSRIPSSHTIIQKDTEKTDIATPKQNSQNVATYSEKGQILLYTLGEDNKMTAISNYGLAKQSTWYSDEQITVDGIQYLRVATNKWVKASQVYSYQDLNQYVRTYDKTAKVLYKSEDEVINNRILQPNTSWFSDRTTYVINGDKYYRVATNEFVSAKDAYIYQPTNMVVKTHTDSPSKNLYTAKGELITNRSLVADSNWLVDSIVYIEGIKYYRVATNEFVKASDVDINH
ncbi:SLAP domain-containing protein, partial [Companilactobacillus farciminis]